MTSGITAAWIFFVSYTFEITLLAALGGVLAWMMGIRLGGVVANVALVAYILTEFFKTAVGAG